MVIGFGAEESMKKAKKAQGEDKIKICAHKRLEFDGPRFVRSVSAALYFDSIGTIHMDKFRQKFVASRLPGSKICFVSRKPSHVVAWDEHFFTCPALLFDS